MLNVQHIFKTFANKIVAHDISFQADKGEITALLGASGSGKSTLLNIIAGLVAADSGSIQLNGRILDNLLPEQRHIAMMFQDFALLPHLNARENVAFGLRMRGVAKRMALQQADEWLVRVGLANMGERKIQFLSGGEQQRTALARALAVSPELLLLDEPFSGIDTAMREQLQHLVRNLVIAQGIPAIMVTHDPAEACLMATQIALLSQGKIIQIGTPTALLQRPISAVAARLLGCLNVTDERYIPPQAINLNAHQGEICSIVSIFRQPNYYRVELQHPQYGALITFADDATAAVLGRQTCVWVATEQVVHFQAA